MGIRNRTVQEERLFEHPGRLLKLEAGILELTSVLNAKSGTSPSIVPKEFLSRTNLAIIDILTSVGCSYRETQRFRPYLDRFALID